MEDVHNAMRTMRGSAERSDTDLVLKFMANFRS